MLKSALRSLTRNPGFTAAAVLTLALGIGANTAMFSVIDGVLLKPLAYREPDRLISLHLRITTLKNLGILPIPPFVYDLWRAHAASLENIAVVRPGSDNFTGGGEPERLLSAHVSASLFPTLGAWPALGRAFAANEDVYQGPQLAILGNGFWRRSFAADPTVVGRQIQLNGKSYTVVGVMPPGFELPIDLETEHASHFDILLPADIAPEQRLNHGYWGVARLRPGVTVEQARAELDANLASIKGNLVRNAVVSPLRTNLTERVERGLSLLMAAVGLVLLIACGNLANLLLSRGLTRRKEIAVRAALGASRLQIVRQLFSESLALALFGGALGAICAGLTLGAILTQLPEDLPHRAAISVDPRTLAFCMAVTFLCAFLSAALPAWRLSKADPQEALRQSQRGSTDTRGSGPLRQWLTAAQVALCTMLVIGAGLLLRSFAKIMTADRGFETQNVLAADVPLEGARYAEPARRNATYQAIERRLAAIPGVSVVGAVSLLPLSGDDYINPIFLPGVALTPDRIPNLPMAQIRFATSGYFRAAGVPLRAGRIYSETSGDLWNAVVGESAARRVWPDRNPIGQEFTIDESPHPRMWTVAGVVADVKQTELQNPAPLMVYLPAAHNTGMHLSFVLRTRLPVGSIAQSVRQAVAQIDPQAPVTAIRTMREIVDASAAQRRFQTLLLTAFAGVATLLAALGIYGTLSYSVNRRYREIGIRLALGAQGRDVGSLVLRQALTPAVPGLAAGSVGAFFLMRALSTFLYGVGSGDAATYSVSATLIFLVAVAACWVPMMRATRLDPMATIRCE
ncbi:MAG: ABC transporter permease [Bryobacteraceae bacterium]